VARAVSGRGALEKLRPLYGQNTRMTRCSMRRNNARTTRGAAQLPRIPLPVLEGFALGAFARPGALLGVSGPSGSSCSRRNPALARDEKSLTAVAAAALWIHFVRAIVSIGVGCVPSGDRSAPWKSSTLPSMRDAAPFGSEACR
jgi:hypothetical protein